MDDFYSDAWNNLTSMQDPGSSSVDSSGNSLSGLQIPSFLKLGSTILGGVGDLMVGDEKAGAYDYNADLALQQGQIQLEQLDTSEEDLLSTQKAMYAKAGVTQSGSPLDAALNSATQAEMDKQISRYNTESKVNMYRYQAQVAESQAKVKAGNDLFSGAGSMALSLMLL